MPRVGSTGRRSRQPQAEVLAGGSLPSPEQFGRLAQETIIPELTAQFREVGELDRPEDLAGEVDADIAQGEGVLQQGSLDVEFDRIAQAQPVTADEGERRRLVTGLQRIVARDLPVLPLYYPTLHTVFRRDVFDAWYFTPEGFAGGLPGVHNKQALISG